LLNIKKITIFDKQSTLRPIIIFSFSNTNNKNFLSFHYLRITTLLTNTILLVKVATKDKKTGG